MMGSSTAADLILQFSKVVSSSIATDPRTGNNEGLLYSVAGIGGVDYSGSVPVASTDDSVAEKDPRAEAFGQLGILARPLPPYTAGGENRHTEAVSMRTADGMVPLAHRDTRIQMGGSGPGEGTIAHVGYGGGFLAMDPIVNSGKAEADRAVLYCPFDKNSDGVPQKAHAIILDPTNGNESISVVHADGTAITMIDGEMTLKSPNGLSSISISDSGITFTGRVTAAGGLVVGNPSAAVPLLAGTVSPPCSVMMVSP